MKKITLCNEIEKETLYVGIDAIHGGWLLTTGGDPTCLNELEDCQADDEIERINAIIGDPSTPWEPCDQEDEAYIREWLEIF